MSQQPKSPTERLEIKRNQAHEEDRAINAAMQKPLVAAKPPRAKEAKVVIEPYYLEGLEQFEKYCVSLSKVEDHLNKNKLAKRISDGLDAIHKKSRNPAQTALAVLGHFSAITRAAQDELARLEGQLALAKKPLDAKQQQAQKQAQQRVQQLEETLYVFLSFIILYGNKSDLDRLVAQESLLHLPPIRTTHEEGCGTLLKQLVLRAFDEHGKQGEQDSRYAALLGLLRQAGRGGWRHKESFWVANAQQLSVNDDAELLEPEKLAERKWHGGCFFTANQGMDENFFNPANKECQRDILTHYVGGQQATKARLDLAINKELGTIVPNVLLNIIKQYLGLVQEKVKPAASSEDDSDSENDEQPVQKFS